MKKYIKSSRKYDNAFIEQLATDLVQFMQEYDWFEYYDALEVGETEEDAIGGMIMDLSIDPEGIIAGLYEIKENNPSMSDECDDLIDRINEIL